MNIIKKSTIYLLNCALNKKVPDPEALKGADFEEILFLAQYHSIAALVACSVALIPENAGLVSADTMAKFRQAKNNAVRQFILQKQEAQRVFDALENAKIAYLPLKGCVLSDYFEFGLREMSDVDILFDRSRAADSREIMSKLGYEITEFGEDYHDAYFMEPIYNVELHRFLFSPERYPEFIAYYEDVFERSETRPGRQYEHVLSKEEFFVFIMAHAVKHFDGPGTGLRSLADIYVYEKSEQLDEQKITEAFEKLGITKSAALLRKLSNVLLDPDVDLDNLPLDDYENKRLKFITESGTHGTDDHRLEKKINEVTNAEDVRKAKREYVRDRIRLTPRQIEITYPFFYKHKWARPFLIFARIHRGLTVNKDKLNKEMDMLKKK